MNSGNSSDASRLDALRLRIDDVVESRLGDLALERGWITEARLQACQERIDRGTATAPLTAMLIQDGVLTREQVDALSATLPSVALGRLGADVPVGIDASAERFGKFVIRRELGRGGMGTVHAAWQADLGRWVALKRLHFTDPAPIARFIREGRLAAQVVHPNLVPIHEVGEIGGVPYMAMALMEKGSLEDRRLEIRDAIETVMQISLAVHELHAAGIVHRDIKPANLMIDGSGHVFLGDFGLAREESPLPGLSKSGFMLGTPAFAPPEQIRGESRAIGPRSDVYSLGATLYALLTGEIPFTGRDSFEVARRSLESDPPDLRSRRPEAGVTVRTVCWKAMRKKPGDRYASARDLADDLRRILDGKNVLARPPGRMDRLRLFARRRRIAVVLSAVALAGVVAGAVAWRGHSSHVRLLQEAFAEVELSWRAEALVTDSLAWAEAVGCSGMPAPAAEAERRRREMETILGRPEFQGRLARALLARFDFLTGNRERAERDFDALVAEAPDPSLVRVQRIRARVIRLIAGMGAPMLSLAGDGNSSLVRGQPPDPATRTRRDEILDDVSRLSGHQQRLGRDGARFIRACEAFTRGDVGRARSVLEGDAMGPELGIDALRMVALAELHANRPVAAVSALDQALGRNPNRWDLRMFRAQASVAAILGEAGANRAERLLEPIAETGTVLKEFPLWAEAWSLRAFMTLCRANAIADSRSALLQSLADFERARSIRDDGCDRVNQAAVLMSLGDRHAEALALLQGVAAGTDEVAQSAAQNRAGLLMMMGERAAGQGPSAEAERLFRRAETEIDPLIANHATPRRRFIGALIASNLSRAAGDGREAWETALSRFREALADLPGDARSWELFGTHLFLRFAATGARDRGLLEEGLKCLQEAILLKKDDPALHETRGNFHHQAGILEQAMGRPAEAHFTLAIADFTVALDRGSRTARVLLKRSFGWARRADLQWSVAATREDYLRKALQDVDEACSINPRNLEALLHAALVSGYLGEKGEARKWCDKALAVDPSNESLKGRISQILDAK